MHEPLSSIRFEHVRPIIALPVTLPTHVHVARVWQWLPSNHSTPTQVQECVLAPLANESAATTASYQTPH